MHVDICMYVCMSVCMSVYIYMCRYTRIHMCMYACMHACIICMCIHAHVEVQGSVCISLELHSGRRYWLLPWEDCRIGKSWLQAVRFPFSLGAMCVWAKVVFGVQVMFRNSKGWVATAAKHLFKRRTWMSRVVAVEVAAGVVSRSRCRRRSSSR